MRTFTKEDREQLRRSAEYQWAKEQEDLNGSRDLLSTPIGKTLDTVQPERIEWLWRARLALGKMTIFDGDPGLGKSTVTLDIAARVSTGAPFPGEVLGRPPRGVVILSAEDGLADTISPRLIAAGADRSRIYAMTGILTPLGVEGSVSIPDGLAQIKMALLEMDAALLIIDPLVSHFAQSVNANNDQQVRTALSPLMTMLEQTRAAAFMVRHLNKADTKQALYRGGGSIGIIGASRFGMMVARDPDDPESRVMATTKCNLAVEPPSLRYRLESVEGTDVAQTVWDRDAAPYSAGDLLEHASDENQRYDKDEHDEIIGWLQHLLYTEPGMEPTKVERNEILKEAKKRNYGERAMRRAKKTLNIKSGPEKVGAAWYWWLPEEVPWEDA